MKTNILLVMALAILVSCKKEKPTPTTPPPAIEEGGAETVSFSGYTWKVTSSGDETQGPGPNFLAEKTPGLIKKAIYT